MKYILEENQGFWNIFEESEEKKKLVAVVFEETVAKILCREMNIYIERLGM